MPLHDASYKHWEGVHLGLWHRRFAIAENGLTSCLQNRSIKHLVVICWVTALLASAILFMAGQLLVADSLIVQWVGNLSLELQAFAGMLTKWLEDHPEISVRTTQNVLFYYYSIALMPMSIFSLGMAMPLLLTRDLASNSIIIYSSKAVNLFDYLVGKFCTACGLVFLSWLGPLCATWFFGNLLSPDWRFFWHSRAALAHVMVYGLASMLVLGMLSLGISATSSKEKSTSFYWFLWWILGAVLTPIATKTQPWLRHLSFSFNLDQLAMAVFRVGDDIKVAQDNIPILGDMLRQVSARTIANMSSPEIGNSVLALALMIGAAAWIVAKRVKPE